MVGVTRNTDPVDMIEALLAEMPEWLEEVGGNGIRTGWVVCPSCGNGGKFTNRGKPSKRHAPLHDADCIRVVAKGFLAARRGEVADFLVRFLDCQRP